MTTSTIDPRRTERLAKTLPAVIETDTENERILAEISRLVERARLSPEEEKLLRLMIRLVEDFEEGHYQLKAATPDEALRELMEVRGLRQIDLLPVFRSKGIASEVINGKRAISRRIPGLWPRCSIYQRTCSCRWPGASPHFSPVVCCSAGYIRHYCVALGRAPRRTDQVRLRCPFGARLVLAASPTLRDDNR